MLFEHHLKLLIVLLNSFLIDIFQSQTIASSNTVYEY